MRHVPALSEPSVGGAAGPAGFDRRDFPALGQEVRPGVPLVYLDSASTALKPRAVIEAVDGYLREYPANVHRGLHALSERATEAYEGARAKVARFLNAGDPAQVVFTHGTTEAINLVAQSWGLSSLRAGDEVLVTELEHHSNFVPWQMVAQRVGATLKVVPLSPQGTIEPEDVRKALSPRTRILALTGMSNVLGTTPAVEEIVELVHRQGALVLLDGAQSVPHGRTDVQALGVDFLAFSGHKMGGPTGIGVLYARAELLEAMPPMFGGGSMVTRVSAERTEWNEVPWKFEAGTPAIAEAIGLGAAVDYLSAQDWDALHRHERALTERAHEALGAVPGVRLLGPPAGQKGSIVGFVVEGIHPHDLAQLADRSGVAIRAGHHCAMPLHTRLGLPASARASFWYYNTQAEVGLLAEAMREARRRFRLPT